MIAPSPLEEKTCRHQLQSVSQIGVEEKEEEVRVLLADVYGWQFVPDHSTHMSE